MNCQNVKAAIDESTRHEGYSLAVNSHLTGCFDCQGYANEFDSLFALLKTQTRIEAPADFDFKLRARIARAESEGMNASSSVGLLGKIWVKSFSWSQAGAALAAIVLFALASSVFINRTGPSTQQAGTAVAVVTPATKQSVISATDQELPPVNIAKPEHGSLRVASIKLAATPVKPKAANELTLPAVNHNNIAPNNIALSENASSYYIRDKGQVSRISNRSVSIGAEDASLARAQTASLSF